MKSRIWGFGLAVLVLAPSVWLSGAPRSAAAAAARSYAVARFALELDGASVGFVDAVSGGAAVAEVVLEAGPSPAKKHLGKVSYEELELEFGLSLSSPIYDWIAGSWQGGAQRKSLAVVAHDINYDAVSRRDFQNALITETTIPACDAASKQPALLKVKLAPERVQSAKATGKAAQVGAAKQQKQWQSANFRLELDGIDTSHVNAIGAFTIKRAAPVAARGAAKEPSGLEFPNLAVTLSEAGSESWQKWHEDFVSNGTDKAEKSGRLVFLAPNMKDELFEIRLHGVGIFALRPTRHEAGGEKVAKLEAELYCERMEFVPKSK